MKNTLRKILTGSAIAAASVLPMKKAEAQVSGSAEYVQSEHPERSYARSKTFYSLPQRINGFTFMELYRNGSGYFGKTYLDKSLLGRVGPRLMAVHAGEPLSEVGMGISATIPSLPKGAFARFSFLPLWVGNEGKPVGDKAVAQYAFGFNLPKGFNVSGFGDLDVLTQKGPQWVYGEFNLKKEIGPLFVGYNPVLLNDGDASPRLEHRVNFGVNF